MKEGRSEEIGRVPRQASAKHIFAFLSKTHLLLRPLEYAADRTDLLLRPLDVASAVSCALDIVARALLFSYSGDVASGIRELLLTAPRFFHTSIRKRTGTVKLATRSSVSRARAVEPI